MLKMEKAGPGQNYRKTGSNSESSKTLKLDKGYKWWYKSIVEITLSLGNKN